MTGFGPFPNAPENPTARLVQTLGSDPAGAFDAAALRAVVLPTDYRRSWARLRRIYTSFQPDVVIHFGLSRSSECLKLERGAFRSVDPSRGDVAGFAPLSGRASRSGPDWVPATLPTDDIVSALLRAGFAAAASDDPGRYVCNATLYRSLAAAQGTGRLVGFVHVPPEGAGGYTAVRLHAGALLLLLTACRAAATSARLDARVTDALEEGLRGCRRQP